MAADGAAIGQARARAYAQAMRHSRRVRFFKRAIPLGAGVAVALIAGFSFIDPFGRMGGVTLGPMSMSGTQITMERPRLTGFQKDTRPYEVTATAANQDIRKPNLIELENLRARLAMDESGTMARLEATIGVFDTQKEQLELKRDITVRTDSGYDAKLTSAFVDFKAGTVVSREPVKIGLTNGTVEADTLDISDNGKVIVLQGRVRSVFTSPDAPPAAPVKTSNAAPNGQ